MIRIERRGRRRRFRPAAASNGEMRWGACAREPQADRDHAARGTELPRRWDRCVEWEKMVDARRLQRRARGSCCSAGDFRRRRSVLTRGSVPEMVVPYGDTSRRRASGSATSMPESTCSARTPTRSRLGCDCLGVIRYFDGYDRRRPRAAVTDAATSCACTRRTTASSGSTASRAAAPTRCAGSRRLVVVVLHHDRQLRLRLLLVLLPGRLIEVEVEGDGHSVHRRAGIQGSTPARTGDRAGLCATVAPAPLLAHAWT